ncbi:MAG TPA: ABC transporter permease subunit/CPBP intramembrane protease [Schlesneria sp.]|jgi:ABC-2 type transport system permease protein/sodium transport system permease protein
MSDQSGTPDSPRGWTSPRWWRLTVKELREILRDRRTIITLVAMPLLIYPLLGVTLQKLILSQVNRTRIEYRVALPSQHEEPIFRKLFSLGNQLVSRREGRTVDMQQLPQGSIDDPIIELLIPDQEDGGGDVGKAVAEGEADIAVIFGTHPDNRIMGMEIIYRSGSPVSRDARRFIEDRFRALNEDFARHALAEETPAIPLPYDIRVESLTPVGSQAGPPLSLATLVPLILILMTVTGAVYPAIDLTAGERERGTLEALVSSPVPRHELLFAKYVAVVTVAVMTAVANLISMIVTAYASGLEGLLFGSGGLSARLVVLTLSLLFVFAAFFSAVILILTSFARSFKEAQAYLIPLMLVSLAPGIICLLPGIEFNTWLAVTPLANIVLLARDVFDNRVIPIWALATLLSTALYAAVALSAAARIFGTDAVLYGGDGSWSDMLRRPEVPRPQATLGQAMFALAILFPSFLILGGTASRLAHLSIESRLAINMGITILLFAVLPLVLTRYFAIAWNSGLSLRMASPLSFIAAAVLGLSLWPFAYELVLVQSPDRLTEFVKLFESIKAQIDAVPLLWKLIALALVPAACEELFFRGFLQTTFRAEMASPLAVILSSTLFGLFHVVVRDALFFERFAPTCFLGLILGIVCLKTGSVWPGIVLHCIHNGLLLTVSNYTEQLKAWGIGSGEQEHLPASWLVGAGLLAMGAMTVLIIQRPKSVVKAS